MKGTLDGFGQDEKSLFSLEERKLETRTKFQLKENEETRKERFVKDRMRLSFACQNRKMEERSSVG